MTSPDPALHVRALEELSGASLAAAVVSLGALALLTLVMGWLGRAGRIKPNAVFGVRTERTLSDHDLWYRVHRQMAPWAFAAGGSLLAGALAVPFVTGGAAQGGILVAILVVYVLLVCLGSWRLQRAATARQV